MLTLVLAGGQESRLSILGEKRAKPAVAFAGKYRIIDFPLSNAVNFERSQDHLHRILSEAQQIVAAAFAAAG